jgi:peptide/nickel transport system ATP-binding protein
MAIASTTGPLLQIKNATKVFGGGFLDPTPPLVALDDFSLDICEDPPRITTIAGESGSGKTTLASAILGFTPLSKGQILYKGMDVATMDRAQKLQYRKEVQAIFQDPYEVYNPFFRVHHIFDVAIKNLRIASSKREERELIEDALRLVGMRGDEILEKHPHQLSGGQRQRVMVARAYMLRPRLIVADEPVSAVDASLRAMILDIMLRLRDEHKISFLYITHDLSNAYQIGDEMVILFQGVVAEQGNTVQIVENPKHPYVQELIGSIPAPNPDKKWNYVITLPPEDATRSANQQGCRFVARCPAAMERCHVEKPPIYPVGTGNHGASCFLYDNGAVKIPAGNGRSGTRA